MLGFNVINKGCRAIKEMNKDKVGEPFHYPNTFLLLLGYAKAYFHLLYRKTEGIVQEDMLNGKHLLSHITLQ